MNISNNLASIGAKQTFLNNTAGNIKNASSLGSDLTKEIPNLIVAQDIAAVNVSAIKANDEMLGTLLDMKV